MLKTSSTQQDELKGTKTIILNHTAFSIGNILYILVKNIFSEWCMKLVMKMAYFIPVRDGKYILMDNVLGCYLIIVERLLLTSI